MSIHKLLLVSMLCVISAMLVSAVGEVPSCRQITWGDVGSFMLFMLALVAIAWNAATE